MNIIVLGAGTFGTSIANELTVNTANKVLIYSRNQQKVDEINSEHTNKSCFPNKSLIKYLKATSERDHILIADVIFIALPSKVILEYLSVLRSSFKKDVLLVNLSKGLLKGGVTILESIRKELGLNNVVTLKGPSFAIEVMEHADTLLTLGYENNSQYNIINSVLEGTSLHIDSTTDVRGVELLSVLKNVYALVIGVVDAKYNSPNTRFMILTKAFSEAKTFLKLLGGSEDTLFLACGFGDLCMTSLNDLSRNRTLGLLIGKGFFNIGYKSNEVILEGLNAIETLHSLIEDRFEEELPLFNRLYDFVSNEKDELEFTFDELINKR